MALVCIIYARSSNYGKEVIEVQHFEFVFFFRIRYGLKGVAKVATIPIETEKVRYIMEVFDAVRTVLAVRSEEHTSELQSRLHLVCRLLLEKKKISIDYIPTTGITTTIGHDAIPSSNNVTIHVVAPKSQLACALPAPIHSMGVIAHALV